MWLSTVWCTDKIFLLHLQCCCLQFSALMECSCQIYNALSTVWCTNGMFRLGLRCCCQQFSALNGCSCPTNNVAVYSSLQYWNVPVASTMLLSTEQCTNEMFLSNLWCYCLQFSALRRCSGYLHDHPVFSIVAYAKHKCKQISLTCLPS